VIASVRRLQEGEREAVDDLAADEKHALRKEEEHALEVATLSEEKKQPRTITVSKVLTAQCSTTGFASLAQLILIAVLIASQEVGEDGDDGDSEDSAVEPTLGEANPTADLSNSLKNLEAMRAEADASLNAAKRAVGGMTAAVGQMGGKVGALIAKGADGGKSLLDLVTAMDLKADKCASFYDYACGNWIKTTKLPSDSPSWSKTFSTINKANMANQLKMYQRNDTSSYKTVKDDEVKAVKDFYFACMDEKTRNEKGLKDASFTALIAEINDVKDLDAFIAMQANFTLKGLDLTPFSFGVGADDMDSNANIIGISQGGLGLPAQEYYGIGGKDNARFKQVRAAYTDFMQKSFKMAGVTATASAVLTFETDLAKIMWSKTKMRDPRATYFPTTVSNFTKSKVMWTKFFAPLQKKYPAFGGNAKVVLSPAAFFDPLEKLVAKTELATLKAYSMRRMLSAVMPLTTTQAGELNFDFYGKALNGAKERPPIWKRCVGATTSSLWGFADKMFVEKHFGGDSKKLANDMLDGIIAAFQERLDKNTWMDDATRARAKKKLGTMNRKIGAPDVWRAYPGLKIHDKSYLKNELAVIMIGLARNFDKMGQPVDKTEWHMNPSMTNAYYSPSSNEMAFPAGILQPPFFSVDQPAVLNFGAIGAVMGHELTHGFDDQGSQYDASGNMKVWWSNASSAAFTKHKTCMEKQYAAIKLPELAKAAPGLKINGKLTLGENIADNGGVVTALQAFATWEKKKDTPSEYEVNKQVFKTDSLFWLAYGQTWCRKGSSKSLMVQIRSDPHSPARARVQGPAQNTPAFAKTFACKAGSPMSPPDAQRCQPW